MDNVDWICVLCICNGGPDWIRIEMQEFDDQTLKRHWDGIRNGPQASTRLTTSTTITRRRRRRWRASSRRRQRISLDHSGGKSCATSHSLCWSNLYFTHTKAKTTLLPVPSFCLTAFQKPKQQDKTRSQVPKEGSASLIFKTVMFPNSTLWNT